MMDVLKKATTRKIVIEPGEEKLHETYNLKNAAGREIKVILGVDGGSTQTRVLIIEPSDVEDLIPALGHTFTIPSISATVPDDRIIIDKGDSLYDLMDTTLVNLSSSQEVIFSSARLVRGTKFFDTELKENRLKSSTQKTADATYYFNLLDSIGYAVCEKYSNAIPTKVTAYLCVSLPPDDINEKNMEKFREILKAFKWTHRKSGVSFELIIEGVLARTEPEAFIKAFYSLADQDLPDYTLHIEGGGRSVGVEILANGKSLATAQKTLHYGGSQLLDSISGLYVAKNGGSPLKRSVLEEAVRTGKVRSGNNITDITEIIRAAKRSLAEKIVSDIVLQVFDQQSKVSLSDLNVISVSGRLFEATDITKYNDQAGVDEVVGGISLADYVKEGFDLLSPNTQFKHIVGNHIPQGLAIDGVLEFFMIEEGNNGNGGAVSEAASTAESAEEPASVVSNNAGGATGENSVH
jgi:hypothetical protein